MKDDDLESFKLSFFSIITAIIVSGCASFPGRELPSYTKQEIAIPEKGISASFKVKAFNFAGERAQALQPTLEDHVKQILLESSIFSQLELNKSYGEYEYTFVSGLT